MTLLCPVKKKLGQVVCSETTARQFAGFEFLVRCGVRGDGETVTSVDKANQKLVQTARKLATQLLDTGLLWEWS